jgi:ATP-dependent helicase/nuclease subunit A
LNEEQQAAAFCTQNVVVAAGAGSGKTMVLASRYAWLITEKNYQVNEILTLTFTKKAAAQMYQRIHNLLRDIASENTDTEKAGRAKQALDNFAHARIQTLDSYCASLVKQAASRYGISPGFAIDENRCFELAMREALPFLIAHRHDSALEQLYLQRGPETIAREIFAVPVFNFSYLDRPQVLIESIKNQFDIICAEWEKQSNVIKTKLSETADIAFNDTSLLPDIVPLMTQYTGGNIAFPDKNEIRAYFDFLLALPRDDDHTVKAEAHPIQDGLIALLKFLVSINSLDLRWGKRLNNPVKQFVKELKKPLFGEFSSLAVFCMQAGLMLSLMYLLDELQERYLSKKRAEGVLTFNDAARLARTILLEQHDIRQGEKESFKAIMIDEFQDNNELQKELIFLLAEKPTVMNTGIPPASDLSPEKLFFVGDEKQSIYRFRGADVSVFRRLKDEIKSADMPLRINYRSSPQLIGAFNAIFGGSDFDPPGENPLYQKPSVFVPANQSAAELPLYEASYTPLCAGKETGGKITISILDRTDDDDEIKIKRADPVESEAHFVAERIKKLLEEKNEKGKPKYQPSDIAILFRSRRPQHLFERHLRMLGIPYASENLNGFFFGGPVNDIMAMLRLVAYPQDAAAYGEILRSPFAGLSLPGLMDCLAFFGGGESPGPFADSVVPLLIKDDRPKYRYVQNLYRKVVEKSRTENIGSLVSLLWYNEGYRYETEWHPQTTVFRELYDYLFHLAVMADRQNMGLAAFTDLVRKQRDSGEGLSDIEIPLERPSAVHLLTIHKSKGLEFPIVFLCCCDKYGKRGANTGDLHTLGNSGVAFNPPMPQRAAGLSGIKRNFFWEHSQEEEKKKQTAELRRLLYVAMTRAENELYLSGGLQLSGSGGFEEQVKAAVVKKKEKAAGINPIPGDTILNNDTFFGLCLPALTEHKPAFFELEKIPPYTDDNGDRSIAPYPNTQGGLNDFFEDIEPYYRRADTLHTGETKSKHITPTSERGREALEPSIALGRDFAINLEFSGKGADDVFTTMNKDMLNFAFESGNFGIIAHAAISSTLKGEEPKVPPGIEGIFSFADMGLLLRAGAELANRFIGSPLGQIARKAVLRENEYPFRSLIKTRSGEELYVSGTIDLFFECEGVIHVIDFKTDIRESPGEHTSQMVYYYNAVSTLFSGPLHRTCRTWLYYLRSGHAVEMTMKAKEVLARL